MQNKIKEHLESVFNLLVESNQIIFPDRKSIEIWERVLVEWIDDESMTLFARKGSETRGIDVHNVFNRRIITTDNTPAHWVFKNLVLNKSLFTK
jgi:hypothetical protein